MENEYNIMGDKIEIFVATHKKLIYNLLFAIR